MKEKNNPTKSQKNNQKKECGGSIGKDDPNNDKKGTVLSSNKVQGEKRKYSGLLSRHWGDQRRGTNQKPTRLRGAKISEKKYLPGKGTLGGDSSATKHQSVQRATIVSVNNTGKEKRTIDW